MADAALIPALTSAISATGFISSSGDDSDPDYAAYAAFDQGAKVWVSNSTTPRYLQVRFTADRYIVSEYTLTSHTTDNRDIKSFLFQGSDNGTTWDTLDSRGDLTWTATETKTFTPPNRNFYYYYRLTINTTVGGTATVMLKEMSLIGHVFLVTDNDKEEGATMEYRKLQTVGDIIITVPLVVSGAPDTSASLTIKALKPDGTEHTTFTAPTVFEFSGTGIYRLTFPANAATPLFAQEDELNPYVLLVKTATTGSTGYRKIPIHIVSKYPGEVALSTETDAIQSVVDAIPTLAEIEASTTVAALPTLAEIEASTVLAKKTGTDAIQTVVDAVPTLAEILAGGVALDATVAKAATVSSEIAAIDTLLDGAIVTLDALPTLVEIEASTVLAKSAATDFLLKCIKNRKKVKVISGVLYLIIYDDDNTAEILRKAIKDVDGADVADPASGVIAFETKSTV